MSILNRLYAWYGKRVVLTVLATFVTLLVVGVVVQIMRAKQDDAPIVERTAKSVTIARVRDIARAGMFRVVGTVEAVSEAKLQTEASGRITRVSVQLGDRVAAGTVIAMIENSRERASLLQAEGAYDAAVALNAQSEAGLAEAKIAVENVYRKSFTTSEIAINNLADELFSDPSGNISGIKIDAGGRAIELNETRRDIRAMLVEWEDDINTNFKDTTPEALLVKAERNTADVTSFITTLAQLIAAEDPSITFTADMLSAYKIRFEATRAALNGALSDISNERRAFEQAQLAASGKTTSLADAQLKSALGSLRAAQANYEKTLVRTPIAGTVNALYLKEGEFVAQNTPAALIANNGALEIQTAVGEDDAARLHVGDSVQIDGRATGTIARIAPGIDPLTGKIEVRITISEAAGLKNGSTVGVSFSQQEFVSTEITVPIVAVKMLPSAPVVFSVSDTNTLVAHQVVLGAVRGSAVVVLEGLTPDMEIITDARGMQEGELVTVTRP